MFHTETWTFALHTIRNVCMEKKEHWLERMAAAYRKKWELPRARITVPPLSDRWLSDYDVESIKHRGDR